MSWILDPDEVTQFLNGELGSILELRYSGERAKVSIEIQEDGTAIAYIPMIGNPQSHPFDIELALCVPTTGVPFQVRDDKYVVEIKNRSQLRSVISIAMCHLYWHAEDRLFTRYKTKE